jgi:lactoylglutathione lyase
MSAWDAPMRVALEEARAAAKAGNHPFGAVLVVDGEVVLKAQNTVMTDGDPTCHAETNLVRQASKSLQHSQLARATLVTSTEPCAMCSGAIYWAGMQRVVYGCSGRALGSISGEELDIACTQVLSSGKLHKVDVCGPVLEAECEALHQSFWPGWSGEHFGDTAKRKRLDKANHDRNMARFGYTIAYVSDPSRSLAFYTAAFGLERRFVTKENDYGELVSGETTLAFASKDLAKSNLDGVVVADVDGDQPLGVEIALVVPDVPAAIERAEAAGAKVLRQATTKPWGQTVAYVRAPDGVLVELCTPISGS